jgi:D-3-phosphoglycerate dehydrogenase
MIPEFVMAAPIIAVTDSVFPSLDPAKQALAHLNPTYRLSKSVNADDIVAVAKDADAVLVTYAKLTREVLMQLTRCKAIGRFGLGVDNIDLVTAKEKGIAVNYVPDYCIREVSAHAMALLLALIRKIPLSNKLVQSGRWEMPAVVPIRRIEGTVLGLVGFGHIPRLLAPKAQAFGMKVIAYDPFAKPEAFKNAGVESVDFDALLQTSDYVSLHAPLLPETRGMMNAAAFAKLKKGAYIVNTARGPLIDEQALVAALESGQVGGAGLDVVAVEPLAKDSPLLGRDNVIISPHTAFYSIEALDELQTKCASDVARVLSGKKAVYPISA